MTVDFFRSSSVSWKQGIRLQRARWHSCMKWGWPTINSGERLARWGDYWVLTVCWRHFGISWQLWPKRTTSTGAAR